MIDWILRGRYRIHAVLLAYFAIHVVVRANISSSLSFDESEQAFLSQWFSLGYNSQPPLYTWAQIALFESLGYTVLPIALLKNILLFLTYIVVFGFVYHGTNSKILAVVSSIGMLTMPQVAWESHRDLSHTVLVTLATALLLYCVVRLVQTRTTFWYTALGLVCGLGMMSKYNFALSILGVVVASASIPKYRSCLRDPRLALSVLIALAMFGPHAVWAVNHAGMATSKTISQLTTDDPISWIECVWRGGLDLLASTVVCCVVTLAVFAFTFRERVSSIWKKAAVVLPGHEDRHELLKLIERFLICVGGAILVLVISGYAISIKNHWLHPYIFLLPTYLALKLTEVGQVELDRRQVNRLCVACTWLAITVLVASIAKPASAGLREKYSWLNMPYADLSHELQGQMPAAAPTAVFALEMRTAGNLRLHFPSTPILSRENQQLQFPSSARQSGAAASTTSNLPALAVTDSCDPKDQETLVEFAAEKLGRSMPLTVQWKSIHLPYRFGRVNRQKEFHVAIISGDPPARLASNKLKSDRGN